MEEQNTTIFQIDSPLVKELYKNNDNFLIEYSNSVLEKYCVIYFCSNDLYYPNTEIAFKEQLLSKNKFEWYKTRVNNAYKHIFIRDIQKQWYLGGINANLNTPKKVFEFLREETNGYKVITLGSSAGGFAAIIFGQLLKAEKIFSFNGQFEIQSLLNSSTENINPLIFRNINNNELLKWYDTRNFITNPISIFYFQSIKSDWDCEQFDWVKELKINRIQFKTNNHGVPFLQSNLSVVINMTQTELYKLIEKIHLPIFFSIQLLGVFKTMTSIFQIVKFGLKKIYINTFLKFKQLYK